LTEDEKERQDALHSVRKKAEKLQDELEPEEALDILEEAVGEVERFGDELEKGGS